MQATPDQPEQDTDRWMTLDRHALTAYLDQRHIPDTATTRQVRIQLELAGIRASRTAIGKAQLTRRERAR